VRGLMWAWAVAAEREAVARPKQNLKSQNPKG